ncbi:uncharacterized protein LOC124661134 isoform X1 [Lolium rigidum]|uniref:uncharacterized protein LOC124661134 isoform X1 n=1 Tax=Lolium rigidum TaxID=89674 RepID=UPI001F5DB737|nr:uncharacterized protein LOC124661134 isoform X1 [Lolium rigidum]
MLWRATEISQPPKSLRPPSMAEDEQDGAWAHEIPPTLLPRSLRDHVDRIRSCTEKNTGAYEHGETHQGKCCHSSAGSHTQRIYQLKDLLWRLCQTDQIKFIMWMPKDHEGACY